MARHGRGRSGRGFSRVKPARVAWLPATDNAIVGSLSAGNTNDETSMYDFGSANKYADNYGGGDWTVTRMLGSFGISMLTVGATAALVKVCFAIGMVNSRTTVTDSPASQAANPLTFPELSWMVQVCCYINVTDGLSVERCDFDIRGQRIIAERSIIMASVAVDSLAGAEVLGYNSDVRFLVKQRGSRL